MHTETLLYFPTAPVFAKSTLFVNVSVNACLMQLYPFGENSPQTLVDGATLCSASATKPSSIRD